MVIRSYTADSVARALKQVRTEMGGDAVVLKTRVVDGENSEKQYEVTACLDQPTVEQADHVLHTPQSGTAVKETPTVNPRVDLSEILDDVDDDAGVDGGPLTAVEKKLDLLLQANRLTRLGLKPELDVLDRAAQALRDADVPESFVVDLLKDVRQDHDADQIDPATIRRHLTDYLDYIIGSEMSFKVGDRVVVVGPAGSGKTSIIGRIAAKLVHTDKLKVKLVSLDNFKVGAHDEIASYADLLGVNPVTGGSPNDDDADADADKVVLIDTCAWPKDAERLGELKEAIGSLNPTHRLVVFSALTRSSDVQAATGEMAWLEPTHLVFTQTDLTRRWGGMLAATSATNLKLAMITDSPSGAEAYRTPDAAAVAAALLGGEDKSE
jgi:flagellar biosynthesis protein FlhF